MNTNQRNNPVQSIPIMLASTSPRRISLLELIQITAQVYAPDTDEKMKRGETPSQLVQRLAEEKAEAVVSKAIKNYETSFILAADTVVVEPKGNKVLGKPKDEKDARKMLRTLSGKKHTVLTGYCILLVKRGSHVKKCVRVVQSKVKIRDLTSEMIARYVASGEPMDKAGAYGAQGLGTALIESIQGSYTNVVGFPLTQIFQDMEDIFDVPLFSWLK